MSELKNKVYYVGEFFIEKYTEEYTEEAVVNIPDTEMGKELKKTLKKANAIPYIVVGDNIGVWTSSFRVDSNMYMMLDTIETNEHDEIVEDGIVNVLRILCMMNCVVGDPELMLDKLHIMEKFRERMEKKAAEEQEEK